MTFTIKRDETEYAFPTTRENLPNAGSKGMSLQDYFAGQALAGLLAAPHNKIEDIEGIRSIAEFSYDLADAMIEARDGRTSE